MKRWVGGITIGDAAVNSACLTATSDRAPMSNTVSLSGVESAVEGVGGLLCSAVEWEWEW